MANELVTYDAVNTGVQSRTMASGEMVERYEDNPRSQVVEEFLCSIKESRLTTKKAVDSSFASAKKIEKQNEEIIAECKRQLSNEELNPEQQLAILRIMDDARRDSVDVDRENREFVDENLEYIKAMPWMILGSVVLLYVGNRLITSKK